MRTRSPPSAWPRPPPPPRPRTWPSTTPPTRRPWRPSTPGRIGFLDIVDTVAAVVEEYDAGALVGTELTSAAVLAAEDWARNRRPRTFGASVTVLLFILGVLFVALGVAVSIALHEVGHLLPAKLFKVRVPAVHDRLRADRVVPQAGRDGVRVQGPAAGRLRLDDRHVPAGQGRRGGAPDQHRHVPAAGQRRPQGLRRTAAARRRKPHVLQASGLEARHHHARRPHHEPAHRHRPDRRAHHRLRHPAVHHHRLRGLPVRGAAGPAGSSAPAPATAARPGTRRRRPTPPACCPGTSSPPSTASGSARPTGRP